MKEFEIICIDDEKEILDIYELELAKCGCTIKSFVKPDLAYEYIIENAKKIVLIVSDYKMPEMTGLELRKMLNANDVMIPFLMVTGFYSKEMALEGMELKISKFINKPFRSDELSAVASAELDQYLRVLNEEREMIKSFVEESSPMLEEIEDLILVLEEEPHNLNALNTYFRLLHTIKGTASCVGLKTLPEFAHKYEDLIGSLKNGDIQVNDLVINTFLKGLDVLKRMYSSIANDGAFEFDIQEDLKIFNTDFKNLEQSKNQSQTEVKEVEVVDNKAQSTSKDTNEKINVQVSILDNFMELSGEMTVLRNMIVKSVSKIEQRYQNDKDVDVLSDSLDEMHKVSSILQNQISEMRKISVESIYRPLKRIVRDASKKLKKEVNIEFEGEELKVDTSIAKILNGVLIHLLRNGVDHGIELPETRTTAGKQAEGNILLSTVIDGENILVTISDDGNGMNPDKLKAKAIENGLFTKEQLDKMSEQRIFSLIFESGFSTAGEVTDISGRGVGMDMVRSSVEAIGGKIVVESKYGEGSKFILVLPVPRSVLIIKSLMVGVSGNQFAVPLQDIDEVVSLDDDKILSELREIDGAQVLCHHGRLIPLINLHDRFHPGAMSDRSLQNVIVIDTEGMHFGLLVDEVFDIEEVVLKKFSGHLQSDTSLFQGATLIGDGDIALILDLENIAHSSNIVNSVEEDYITTTKNNIEPVEYLQFSLEDQRSSYAVSLSMVDRLEEFAMSDIEYTGNNMIIRYRDSFLPLVNLESVLYQKEAILAEDCDIVCIVVNLEGQKLGLLVNRIGDIANVYETLDDTFYNGSGILGTVFINEKTVNVLDLEFVVKSRAKSRHQVKDDSHHEDFETAA
ncbi:chemotaxis protein CheW [Bacteriovorax sp. Seq25_V]|uniref:chemotaxis protein CheW n=1 Tax=Bacteriovorax sp. Seq25_V TaxID=1201288 RepID=UPI000389F3F4|nr:chemotaxis protein CheW [Bacteriovorax sp. Seq25_V]EQC47303.1 CheW-like protein [Bacteriovorax sp. Seq25_V]